MATRRRHELGCAALVGVACAILVGACRVRPPAGAPAAASREVRSNILRADYAGSAACASCHPRIYAAWLGSPMHRMTRRAARAAIQAPFDGRSLRVADDVVTLDQHDGRRFMRIESPVRGTHLYRVTKVIGGRTREDFVGFDVTDTSDPVTDRGRSAEKVLPATYVFATRSLRYKGYSVMLEERPGLRAGPVWAKTCIGCHNTLPYLTMLYDDAYGPGAPVYQGSVTDRLLPADRMWPVSVTDPAGLTRAIGDEVGFLGGTPAAAGSPLRQILGRAIAETRLRLRGSRLVEVGVGCEACHGGARAHVADPTIEPSFALRSSLLARQAPAGTTRAQWINRTCMRCHTVLFSGYPWTWEGGRRDDAVPGGSTTNSGEARDFQLGGCASQLSCVACHDPHAEDRPGHLAELAGPVGDALCASCHPKYASPAAVAAHTHHRPGPGSACLGCHMPRKNMGLTYGLTRYHRIGSPTDEARVLRDRPLECALCHQDRSVEDLVATMERWWGKRYDRAPLRALYGDDLGVNAIRATLARGKPHEQAVAISVLGAARATDAVPSIVPALAHRYPLVRYFARQAIETITGEPLAVDVNQPAAEVAAAAARWLVTWRAVAAP